MQFSSPPRVQHVARVSICLPCLNSRRFLCERLESILSQTFQNWELVVVDSYSDDGSWELLQECARHDQRVKLFQAPREGIYAGINACIQKSQGEFVYIATSDDTMEPRCLEIMVSALEARPECDLATCNLILTDEQGSPLPVNQQWRQFDVGRYFGDLLDRSHVRMAPHDGLLHYAVFTVYTSLTQLLVRRDVFRRVGLFDTSFGSYGDFEWEMRTSLCSNAVHIPVALATWRQHRVQATKSIHHSEGRRLLLRMSRIAWKRAAGLGFKMKHLSRSSFERRFREEFISYGVIERKGWMRKALFLACASLSMPLDVVRYVRHRLNSRTIPRTDWQEWMRACLRDSGISAPLTF